jgi:phage gp29-like protein
MISFKNPFKRDTTVANSKETKKEKRELVRLSSKQKDILTTLFSLPVSPDWLTDEEIDKITRDSTVTSSIGSRKAATLKKEILISCDDEFIKENLEAIFDYDTLDSILDTPYQGFSVFELNWSQKDDFNFYPKLVERNYKEFQLHKDVLKFAGNGLAEDIAPYKAIHATYKAKYNKLYGQPIYAPLFWLIEFKNASLEFWIELLERFGTPWVIGKTEGNKDDLADEIYNMLGGDGAVLDTEDSIDLKTISSSDKANFKEIIEYIDDQIRQLILGGNLTSNVKGGSQAAATVHNEIREDLAKADENIVNKIIKEIIKNFKELNHIDIEIIGRLKDIDDPNKELADRDKVIVDMGFELESDYIEKTYGVKVKPKEANIIPNSKLLSFSKTLPQDELELQSNSIDTINPLTFQKQILKLVENSTSYEELQESLLDIYPNIDTKDLVDLLFRNLANSDIQARAEIEDENPNG